MAECRHPDIQRFGEIRCCLSCGEAIFEETTLGPQSTSLEPSPQYQYKPLKQRLGHEIRLIVLYPGEPLDELFCDLVTANLADRPSYEAVSYTWANSQGDASLTSEVRCRGSTIAITKNCESALRRLRLQGRNRRLWVDAICINQNDSSEKSHQVRLMSTIYSNAAQVLSYLGVNALSVTFKLQEVINFLQDMSQAVPTNFSSGKIKEREILQSFLQLPYFDRVWIMQEIGLAQLVTLVIGDYEIRWTGDAVSRTLSACSYLGLKPPSVLRWTPSSRPEEQDDILAVLSKSRNCSARDPRDKVYALLGLMDSKFSSAFPVDYSAKHPEVYAKLATYCVEKLERFDVLQHCQHVSDLEQKWQNTREVPSWIPQWDFKDAYEPLPAQFAVFEKQAFASAWHMAPTNPGAWLRNELPLALLLERIINEFTSDHDSYAADANLSTATCRKQVRKWSELQSIYNPDSTLSAEDDEHLVQEIVYRQSSGFSYKIIEQEILSKGHPAMVRAAERFQNSPVPTSPKVPCLKLRAHRLDTITRDLDRIVERRIETIPTLIPRGTCEVFGVSFCQICNPPPHTDPAYQTSFREQRKDLVAKVETLGPGKTAFATTHSIGFTHGRFLPGDSVWALYGADVPFILREKDGHHELVGDCYLHRAGQPFLCEHCGSEAASWPIQTEIIDIW